jgi:hypothetical protein
VSRAREVIGVVGAGTMGAGIVQLVVNRCNRPFALEALRLLQIAVPRILAVLDGLRVVTAPHEPAA